MAQGRAQYSASAANADAHFPPPHLSLTQSLSAAHVAPMPSNASHTLLRQRDPALQSPLHACPGPGSATHMPAEHAPSSGLQSRVVLSHVAPAGWRTIGTHFELTQLAPAVASPLTGSSAQDAYVMHAPPAGTAPVHVSSQVSSSATSAAASAPAQSAARIPSRQRPAFVPSQVAAVGGRFHADVGDRRRQVGLAAARARAAGGDAAPLLQAAPRGRELGRELALGDGRAAGSAAAATTRRQNHRPDDETQHGPSIDGPAGPLEARLTRSLYRRVNSYVLRPLTA
jgi:hypothetical protein